MPQQEQGVDLCQAAERGDVAAVARLLAAGVPADAPCGSGHSLLHDGHGHVACGWTPLLYASWEGHEGVARLLLDAGADPDRQIRAVTPLWLAAEGGHVGLMRLLLGCGARTRFPHPRFAGGSLVVITAAARSGSAEAVRLLLDAGESPNAANVTGDELSGYTALQAAANLGHAEVVRLLLARGADVNRRNAQGDGPLTSAIYYANGIAEEHPQRAARSEVLALLLATGPPLGLHEAAALGDVVTLRRLLDVGDDIHAEDRHGRTALYRAIDAGRTEAVDLLLDRGARFSGTFSTMLAVAADSGRVETAAYLLDQGAADIVADGAEALVYAAMGEHADMVRLLLERGVPADANDGKPLQWAANRAHAGVLRLLLEHGADPNRVDADGQTPLMRAAQADVDEDHRRKALAALLEHGADPLLRDRRGVTALDFAEDSEDRGAADLLRRASSCS